MRNYRWLSLAVSLATLVTLSAQTSKPTFDVASIKKRDSPLQGFGRLVAQRGTFSVPSTTLSYLVQFAYQVRDDLIVDGPAWIRSDLFDVNAKAGRDVTADEMRPMMQSLLAERFKLDIRREQRVMPHFALVPARTDGRLGPNIQKTDDCRDPKTRPAPPPEPAGAASNVGCGTMSQIATMASRWMRLPVIDQTGISGTFRHYMFVSPEDMPMPNIPGAPSPRPVIGDPTGLPSFRDALRDQLGLKLESVRGPLDVLAIKSVEQPTEN